MNIIGTYMVPHPPLIVPNVGKGEEEKIIETTLAYEKVADEIANIKPDTIIISSPHAPLFSDGFYISKEEVLKGNFGSFGASEVSFTEINDLDLAKKIEKKAKERNILAVVKDNLKDLDHASMVPLYFIRKKYNDFKTIIIGLSGLSLVEHYMLGQVIQEVVNESNKKVVYVASGDLSHKLQDYGPYGYIEEGPVYDEKIMDVMSNAKFEELLEFDETFLDKAAECGHRSFTIMAGVLDGYNVQVNNYSHEDITGVGYGICSFYPKEKNSERNLLEKYLDKYKESIKSDDPFVVLAKDTINEYITNKKILEVPKNLSKELIDNQAGVFVSIHKFGNLRGCVGTIQAVMNSIAEEIIHNAISASTKDLRFNPITEDELPYLEINVDVLSPREKINSKDELDPKKYGVIVSSGYKRGLLLPDLEGIETVDEQIRIAKSKGNISNDEDYQLERFEVIRHK